MPRSAPKLEGGSLTLDATAFEAHFNMPLVHETVRAEQNARRRGTARVGRALPGLVVGDAATGHVLECLVVLDVRIEFPAQLSGRCIERVYDLVRRPGVE